MSCEFLKFKASYVNIDGKYSTFFKKAKLVWNNYYELFFPKSKKRVTVRRFWKYIAVKKKETITKKCS